MWTLSWSPSKAGDVTSLAAAACRILTAADPQAKVVLSGKVARAWTHGLLSLGEHPPPDRPARPLRPALLPPGRVARRKISRGPKGRTALLHAIAHIELNAIDLAWDLVARFSGLPRAFYDDWVAIAAEEAKHFGLVASRLADLGAAYGDLPAHDGLWESARDTQHDLAARLAVVPMVLEARGLDVTPAMIAKLRRVGDHESGKVLDVIYRDEIGHVADGRRWFEYVCGEQGLAPETTWRALVSRYFKGKLKPPFNEGARRAAGFDPARYFAGSASEVATRMMPLAERNQSAARMP